jgi:hypothetical protein
MSENKTTPNAGDAFEFIAGVEDDTQRADAHELAAIMSAASGQPPVMWGTSIIGFGSTHYKYASGREGDTPTIGFSPRKGKFALYRAGDFRDHSDLLEKLGKHDMGVGCLYLKRLSDVDTGVLAALLERSYEAKEHS